MTATASKPFINPPHPALRPEQLPALGHADSAIAIAERPVEAAPAPEPAAEVAPIEPTVDPEIAAKIAKEEAKLAREERAAAARRARIEAYKAGAPIPPVGSKGLPPVVKMNELPTYYHVSFDIAGRTVSERVYGVAGRSLSLSAAYARLDLLVEQHEEQETQQAFRRVPVLATNCQVRPVTIETDPMVRSIAHESAVASRLRRWGL